MMPRAILFDLDETLTDRAHSIIRYAERFQHDFRQQLDPRASAILAAALLAADERGYRPRAEVSADILQRLPWRDPPSAAELDAHWQAWFPPSAVAREGMYELLDFLRTRGMLLGVVTNGGAQSQQAKLESLGLRPYLSSVIISAVAGVAKPDQRIFELALRELGCRAAEVWFVGDHPLNDVRGAAAAGLQPIWLAGIHPWPANEPAPSRTISHLHELVVMVEQEH